MPMNRVLLVEGKDDLHVIAHILGTRGYEGQIFIRDQEGVKKVTQGLGGDYFEDLLNDLSAELKGSEVTCLGIVVDSDLDVAARWNSIADKLRDLGYVDVPVLPVATGTILLHNSDLPKIGVWLMPDNTLPGMLEDFVQLLVPDDFAPLMQRAVEAIALIPPDERLFVTAGSDKTAKAQIHTYLAWRERPGVPCGIAIRENFLAADSPNADTFVTWIETLFEL